MRLVTVRFHILTFFYNNVTKRLFSFSLTEIHNQFHSHLKYHSVKTQQYIQ